MPPPSRPLPPRPPAHVQRADFPEVIRLLDRYYGHADYSLTSLFTDEQRRIVQLILNSTLWDIENSLTTIYQDHASLLHYLSQAGLPKPPALTLAAGFAINAGLRRALESDPIDLAQLRSFLSLAKADQVPLDTATLSYIADQRMKRAMVELQMSSGSLEMLDRALALARTLIELPFELNLWQAQNIWYEILRTSDYALTALEPEDRPRWEKDFNELGACLTIDTEAMRAGEQADALAAADSAQLFLSDLDQLSLLQRESFSAPHDRVSGKACHPQTHRDHIAERQQPKIRQHLVIAQHRRADGHGLRKTQKEAQPKQP